MRSIALAILTASLIIYRGLVRQKMSAVESDRNRKLLFIYLLIVLITTGLGL